MKAVLLVAVALFLGNVHVYSHQTSIPYLMYAYSAYCESESLMEWQCYWCTAFPDFQTTKIFFDSKTETYGYAGFSSNEIVVSFRGSSELENWITNLEFSKIEPYENDPNVGVHSGFYKAWLTVKDAVEAEVARLKAMYPNKVVLTTGHSLGAALTTLCAADLAAKHPSWSIVNWNFGCPRIGNAGWVSMYRNFTNIKPSYRVINQYDMVPQVPPEVMKFQHEPQEIWYSKGTEASNWKACDPNNGEDKTCQNSVTATSIDDHLNYLGFYLEDGNDYGC